MKHGFEQFHLGCHGTLVSHRGRHFSQPVQFGAYGAGQPVPQHHRFLQGLNAGWGAQIGFGGHRTDSVPPPWTSAYPSSPRLQQSCCNGNHLARPAGFASCLNDFYHRALNFGRYRLEFDVV